MLSALLAGGVAPTPLVAERAGQGLYIVPHEVNVSGGGTLFVGQTIGIEGAADLRPGLGRDPADQPLVAEILQEDGRYFFRLDLPDQGRDVAGRGLGLGGDANRREKGNPVGRGEIAEGV